MHLSRKVDQKGELWDLNKHCDRRCESVPKGILITIANSGTQQPSFYRRGNSGMPSLGHMSEAKVRVVIEPT